MEQWKEIEGFANYEISSYGRVRNTNSGLILKPILNTWGYPYVTLCDFCKRKNMTIHRLVAQAFIPNPKGLPEVNHIDEDKTNNDISNLVWVTKKENMNHGTRTKRASESRYKKVNQYTKDGVLVKVWDSLTEAEKSGYHHSAISECCNGKRNFHCGYVWGWA